MTTAVFSGTSTEAPLTVERIGEAAEFETLRDEWNELLKASDSDCLFLTWEWLYTWWKHLAEDRQLSIFAVRCGGELTAIAPLAVRPANLLSGRTLPICEFLGNGCVGSDYLDFIVRRGCEAQARQALGAALCNRRYVFHFAQLRRGGCFAGSVGEVMGQRNWSVLERVTSTCPFIPLSGLSWEGYLASLGAEHRYQFRRKWRRLNSNYEVNFEQATAPSDCRSAIDLAIRLHNERWRGRGTSDAFHTEGLVAFHREFARLALERGWLRLYTMRLNQQPAACLYGFYYRKTFYFYQSGFDPAHQKDSVGLVSMGLGIKSAIDEGAEEYDLLHGDEGYKAHWSRDRRDLTRLELYPPGASGTICRLAASAERRARRTARLVLTRLSA